MIASVMPIHTASIAGDRSDMRLVRGGGGGRPGSTVANIGGAGVADTLG